MTFLNPWMLFGTLAVAAPIAIHLLNRYRPRVVKWGAMELLRRAMVVRSRQIRIEDLLLLILRCLAILLLAFALARPTVMSSGATMFGGTQRPGVVVAIDGSFSMAHQPGVKSRFDEAVARTQELMTTLSPGTPLTLILMGESPKVLHNGGYDPEAIEKQLEEIKPLPQRLRVERSMEDIVKHIGDMKAAVRECYIITDMQQSQWSQPSEATTRLVQEAGELGTVFFVPIGVQDTRAANLAITRFELASGTLRRGATARFRATVQNFGDVPESDVAVRLVVNGVPIDRKLVESIGPAASADVSLLVTFEEAGPVRLEAALERDALSTDNVRRRVAMVREQFRVLCVSGDPNDVPARDEVAFLTTALNPRPDTAPQSAIDVVRVPWVELSLQRIETFDVVILANVPDLTAQQVQLIRIYVERGGGLVFYAGANVNPAVFNARFAEGVNAIAPATLSDAVGDTGRDAKALSFSIGNGDSSIESALRALPADLIDAARIYRYFPAEPMEDATVLLSISDGSQSPLLIDRALGRGRVLMWTTTADRDWGDLAIHPAFVIGLHQSLAHMTRTSNEAPSTVGQSLTATLPLRPEQDTVTFTTPDGESIRTPIVDREGQPVVELATAEQAGFYSVAFDKNSSPIDLAVNVDVSESDVRSLDAQQAATVLGRLPVVPVLDGPSLVDVVETTRVGYELWKPLAVLALIVFAIEALLARWFTKRMAVTRTETHGQREAAANMLNTKRQGRAA